MAHGHQQVQNRLLEEGRLLPAKPPDQLDGDVGVVPGDALVDLLHRVEEDVSVLDGLLCEDRGCSATAPVVGNEDALGQARRVSGQQLPSGR